MKPRESHRRSTAPSCLHRRVGGRGEVGMRNFSSGMFIFRTVPRRLAEGQPNQTNAGSLVGAPVEPTRGLDDASGDDTEGGMHSPAATMQTHTARTAHFNADPTCPTTPLLVARKRNKPMLAQALVQLSPPLRAPFRRYGASGRSGGARADDARTKTSLGHTPASRLALTSLDGGADSATSLNLPQRRQHTKTQLCTDSTQQHTLGRWARRAGQAAPFLVLEVRSQLTDVTHPRSAWSATIDGPHCDV